MIRDSIRSGCVLAAIALGVFLGGWYSVHEADHIAMLDKFLGWSTDVLARTAYAKLTVNESLINDAERRLGTKSSDTKLRVLILSLPEEARWETTEDNFEQLVRYGDTIPDWSSRDMYTPSSYKLSESFGAFLSALDPEQANNSPEWQQYRATQRELLKDLTAELSKHNILTAHLVATTGKIKQVTKTKPRIADDLSRASEQYNNEGNWRSDQEPAYSTPDSLQQWITSGTSGQVFLYKASSQEVLAVAGDTSTPTSARKATAELEVGALRLKIFPLLPGRWFNRALIARYKDGPWLTGAPGWTSSRFFGSSGIMALLPRALIVAQRPSAVLHLSAEDYEMVEQHLNNDGQVSIGGINFTNNDVNFSDARNHTISMQEKDSEAYIIGVVAEVLP